MMNDAVYLYTTMRTNAKANEAIYYRAGCRMKTTLTSGEKTTQSYKSPPVCVCMCLFDSFLVLHRSEKKDKVFYFNSTNRYINVSSLLLKSETRDANSFY